MARANAAKRPRGAPKWNPLEYEDYNVVIVPTTSKALGRGIDKSRAAVDKVLKSLHIYVDDRHYMVEGEDEVVLSGPGEAVVSTLRPGYKIDGLGFDKFRDLIVALEFRGFKGSVRVDGLLRIEYEEEAKASRARHRLRKKHAAARRKAETPAQKRAARHAMRRALKGT